MTASRPRFVAAAWAVATAALVLSVLVLLQVRYGRLPIEEGAWTTVFGAGYLSVGAFIMIRRPGEPIGPLAFGIGLLAILAVVCRAIATLLDIAPGDPLPVTAVVALLAGALQTIALFLGAGPLLVRFPDGRVPRLGRAVDAMAVLVIAVQLSTVFVPGYVRLEWVEPVVNPVGVPILGEEAARAAMSGAFAVYVLGVVVAVLVCVRRYVASGPVVRAQIRWIAAVGALQVALIASVPLGFDVVWALWLVSTALLPVAIGVAILRYHLFAIDRIVSRTLSYALVTALLAGVFVVSNLALQAVLAGATGASTVVVAGSTLLVAALFQPVRRPVQASVDRRFNRSRLDGERVVSAFARRTRDEVDIGRLREAVLETVEQAVAPAGTALWLRGTGEPA
jgi:hypothetical protein